jgi:hypothetical protein
MRRVLDLYDHPPADGRVVCVDEFGPLNLQPRKGKVWRPQRQSLRQRATYTRTSGVVHMLAALDLATGKLFYRIRDRKRFIEFLDLLKALRARWPREKLYVVCDNFSPHRHAQVCDWCAANQVELVFLPTYGSWLNWIEAEFAALPTGIGQDRRRLSHSDRRCPRSSAAPSATRRHRPKTRSRNL